jgi:siroheme synthase (precorrin-2 oxidase/ferrochelatase)
MRRGELMITVSTAGASPALASFLRSRLESAIGPEFSLLVDSLAAERAAVHAGGRSTEDIDWAPIIARAIDDLGIDSSLLAVEVAR